MEYKQYADYLIYEDGTIKSLLTGKNMSSIHNLNKNLLLP
jgi:hypothetical protein